MGTARGTCGFCLSAVLLMAACNDGDAAAGTGGAMAAGGRTGTGGGDGAGGTPAASGGQSSGSGGTGSGGATSSGGTVGTGTLPRCDFTFTNVPDAADVTACKAEAQFFHDECDSEIRYCIHNSYAKMCETDRADVIVEAYGCLDRTCRTFSDPNSADVCLHALHADRATADTIAYDARLCELCPEEYSCLANNMDGYDQYTSIKMDPARVSCGLECLNAATTCEEALACRRQAVGDVLQVVLDECGELPAWL